MSLEIFRNKLIVGEGGDSTGKTSVLELLARDLREDGQKVILTRMPGGDWGPLAPLVRSMCKDKRFELGNYANLFAFLLDRAECLEKIIKPGLDSGKTILCDRWTHSTVAFQFYGKGMLDDFKFFLKDDKKVSAVKEWIECSFFNINPDFTFYFPVKIGEREKNAQDIFENMGTTFEKRVKDAYDEMSERLDWYEVYPGDSAEETLKNLYEKVETRESLL
jgi:dTMP kinase